MSSLASILLIESNTPLRQQIKTMLKTLSCSLTETSSIAEAFRVIEETRYDLVVVATILSDGSGIEITEYLADTALRTKVVMLCEPNCTRSERISLYEAGACDCLQKPIDLVECKYKLKALLHLEKILPNQTLTYRSVKLNPDNGTLYLGESKTAHLRKKESAILTCLLRHRPRIVTKSMIIDYVWGETEQLPTHSTIDVYVRRIRTKLGTAHNIIKTARGYGYYIS